MKARYRYRCYPTPSQKLALVKLFACVRVVGNDSLAFGISEYIGGKKKPKNAELQKQFITQAKKLEEREWLSEVSAVPLQQSLNDLEQAYQNFGVADLRYERLNMPVIQTSIHKASGC